MISVENKIFNSINFHIKLISSIVMFATLKRSCFSGITFLQNGELDFSVSCLEDQRENMFAILNKVFFQASNHIFIHNKDSFMEWIISMHRKTHFNHSFHNFLAVRLEDTGMFFYRSEKVAHSLNSFASSHDLLLVLCPHHGKNFLKPWHE